MLSTHSLEHEGYPFGSVTPFVLMPNGNLVVYISSIAQHTLNIESNPKVCLTILEREEDSQASGRVAFLGDARSFPKIALPRLESATSHFSSQHVAIQKFTTSVSLKSKPFEFATSQDSGRFTGLKKKTGYRQFPSGRTTKPRSSTT